MYEVNIFGVNIIFRSGPWSDTGEDLPEAIDTSGLTPLEAEVYKAIAEGRYTTAENMAISSDSSVRTVKRILYKLRDNGLIQRSGSDKKGTWIPVKRLA